MRRKRNRKQIRILIGLFICLLLVMSVGYAAFNTNLSITAKGNIKDVYHKVRFKTQLVENNTLETIDGWEGQAAGDIQFDKELKYKNYNSIRVSSSGSPEYRGIRSIETIRFNYKPNQTYQQTVYIYRDSNSKYGDMNADLRMYLPSVRSFEGTTANSNVCTYNHYITVNKSKLNDKSWSFYSSEFKTPALENTECKLFERWRMDYYGAGSKATSNVWIALPSFYEVEIKEIKKYHKVGTLPVASKEGYTFDGWYTDEFEGTKIDENYEITKDVDFYARFIAK
ncbi:MAG: InlB B-repeat-containing protein [Bacilli bacterium]